MILEDRLVPSRVKRDQMNTMKELSRLVTILEKVKCQVLLEFKI
jgi:hypothetical protein